jgi:excisionase family DNA binding protein
MADEEPPELMTVKETAEYLRIPLPTVYYLVQRGQLPAIQIGGRWRIKRSLLDRDILKTDEGGQPTVLVVDDDPALQTLFKQFLKKAGFGRIVVGTGAEALNYAEKQRFDLVFLDLKLPDIPGDELYAKLKSLYPDLPIVIITGYPDSEILTKILSSGPVTVIKKPIEYDQLNRTVKNPPFYWASALRRKPIFLCDLGGSRHFLPRLAISVPARDLPSLTGILSPGLHTIGGGMGNACRDRNNAWLFLPP